MAPDAPPPVFDSHGNTVAGWKVSLEYDPNSDQVYLYWHQDESVAGKARSSSESFPPEEVMGAISLAKSHAMILSARRLF